MEATKQQSNDYAVAKELNDCVLGIFSAIQNYQIIGSLKDFDSEELNRIYVLLVDELEKLYERNPKLAAIKPEPTWKQFEIIKNSMYSIQKYLEEHDSGHIHRDKIEKLCIIADKETPDFSPLQKKLVETSKTINAKYHNLLIEKLQKLLAEAPDAEETRPPRMWYIPEYTIEYKPDGTILINSAFKLKKIHAGSTTERLMEQAVKNPETLFKPSLGQTARNISTVLSSAGFTPTLRELFFPTVSDDKGIIFRPKVTREVALDEKVDVFKLDEELHKAGAKVTLFPEDFLIDLGFLAPDEPN
jgi:hypothetical protein